VIIALHSVLRAGAEHDYDTRHARLPDDLVLTFARIGIHDWSIWRSGRDLFHLVDCDDWLAANEALTDDPANLAWQSDIGRFVEHFVQGSGPGPAGQVLPHVYSLREQLASSGPGSGPGIHG
jgi:L-rhamnose mutarotase